jgi:hypothetical protein
MWVTGKDDGNSKPDSVLPPVWNVYTMARDGGSAAGDVFTNCSTVVPAGAVPPSHLQTADYPSGVLGFSITECACPVR